MAADDTYASYEELRRHETEGRDYSITMRPVAGSAVAILAPHGGGIEFLTAELAEAIADGDYNSYAFRGLKKIGNRVLHITSHRFDEPRALELIGPCAKVLSVHGLAGDQATIQVGGRDAGLRGRVHTALSAAGFDSKVVTSGEYGGMEPTNICNRGKSREGAQLEITAGLRRALADDSVAFLRFVEAVRSALQ